MWCIDVNAGKMTPPQQNYKNKSQKNSTQITKLMYVRGHSKETTEMAAALEERFLLWIGERKYPEASPRVQNREKKKQIGHIQGYLRERLDGTGVCQQRVTYPFCQRQRKGLSPFDRQKTRAPEECWLLSNQQKSFYSPGGARFWIYALSET